MSTYRVYIVMDVDATSPEAAAEIVRDHHLDETTVYCVAPWADGKPPSAAWFDYTVVTLGTAGTSTCTAIGSRRGGG